MIGQFAYSKAGHDKDMIYVIVAEDKNFVYLADGKFKTQADPKKKSKKHVQLIGKTVEEAMINKLKAKDTVRPEEIKYAIRLHND